MAAIRTALIDWRKYLVGVFTQLLGNPVIGRELRVRVRMERGYLLQAFYLAFLILVVALSYQAAIGDNLTLTNPVEIQKALVEFYRAVLSTLILLIVLVAPALTANAITLERERKTIDLLLATPLTARQLLVGKLVGSFAFIVLLLALTLPISAVSVLLGGVSFPELLKAYLLIACGGLVLCAIALFTSAYARSSTLAVLWSYLRVGGFLLATGVLVMLQELFAAGIFGRGGMGGVGAVNLAFPAALLNPFAAPFVADTQVDLGGWQVPSWFVGVVLCLLFTRLTLTAAARKVGLYDKDMLPSVRRQLLILLPLNVLVCVLPLLALAGGGAGVPPPEYVVVVVLVCFAPFLLLAAWIAPFGKDEEAVCIDDGTFRPSSMFSPSPSGALPFLATAWLLMVGAFLLSFYWTGALAALDPLFWTYFASLLTYFTGLWMLFWGIGRFCSVCLQARSLVAARALTLVAIVAIATLPITVDLMFFWGDTESPFAQIWVFMPLLDALGYPESVEMHESLFLWGSGMMLFALLLGAFRVRTHAAGTETPSHGV